MCVGHYVGDTALSSSCSNLYVYAERVNSEGYNVDDNVGLTVMNDKSQRPGGGFEVTGGREEKERGSL